MDWLVGVQWREVGVHLAVVLSNVEAVGVHILTVERCDREEEQFVTRKLPFCETGVEMCSYSLEFGFSSLARVLPTDEPDEVVNAGVGDGHHCHRMHFLLSYLH